MKSYEKIKLIRKGNDLTQERFSSMLGISRANLANIERGTVSPTPLLITCISLMFNVKKEWLLNDNESDLSALNNSLDMSDSIFEEYQLLTEAHKKFVYKQIIMLLEMQ